MGRVVLNGEKYSGEFDGEVDSNYERDNDYYSNHEGECKGTFQWKGQGRITNGDAEICFLFRTDRRTYGGYERSYESCLKEFPLLPDFLCPIKEVLYPDRFNKFDKSRVVGLPRLIDKSLSDIFKNASKQKKDRGVIIPNVCLPVKTFSVEQLVADGIICEDSGQIQLAFAS